MIEPPSFEQSDIVQETCLVLVRHFRTLLRLNKDELGFHTRLFSHVLHPERNFVYAGKSEDSLSESRPHPEHVVPCAVLITECKRLIKADAHSDRDIAAMLKKHWKVADISKREQRLLDIELRLKSRMPDDWTFETGDTYARLTCAGIVLLPLPIARAA